ncbi:PucR family transcriptional regulator [Nocardia sp. CA-290969]|uniref:PucR family transcriptional regulator n=1 Tax=Nocardia sp. CA-290969 TaxID=3239986 RepID=UPI003D900DDB
MATLGTFALRAGLRCLTPGPADRAHRAVVTGLHEFDPAVPPAVGPGSLFYVSSQRWPAVPGAESLAAELRAAGGVAVVVDNDDRNLPPEFVAACVRQVLPVYLLPKDGSFAQLTHALPTGSQDTETARETGIAAVRGTLGRFTRTTGTTAGLVMDGCVISGADPLETKLLTTLLSREPVVPQRFPRSAPALHLELPESGHALVVANPQRVALNPQTVAGLVRELDAHARSIEVERAARRDSENALIRELIDASVTAAALDPWARSLGVGPGTRVRAVAAVPEPADDPRPLVAALRDLALCGSGAGIAGAHDHCAYALIVLGAGESGNAGVPSAFDHAIEVLTTLFTHRYGATLAIGTSTLVVRGSADLVRGLVDARQWADRTARAGRSDDRRIPLPTPLAATLLAAEPETARTLHRALLQAVVEYDSEKGSRYLDTLRTFLALDGQLGATAAELGIHINTLRYRLARIERLTGRGVHSTADRVDFYLALCLRELSGDR